MKEAISPNLPFKLIPFGSIVHLWSNLLHYSVGTVGVHWGKGVIQYVGSSKLNVGILSQKEKVEIADKVTGFLVQYNLRIIRK